MRRQSRGCVVRGARSGEAPGQGVAFNAKSGAGATAGRSCWARRPRSDSVILLPVSFAASHHRGDTLPPHDAREDILSESLPGLTCLISVMLVVQLYPGPFSGYGVPRRYKSLGRHLCFMRATPSDNHK